MKLPQMAHLPVKLSLHNMLEHKIEEPDKLPLQTPSWNSRCSTKTCKILEYEISRYQLAGEDHKNTKKFHEYSHADLRELLLPGSRP